MLRTIVATILLASTGLPFSSQAETFNTCTGFIDAVPAVISTQGVYCLRKDVVTTQTNGEAIAVTANNVTLDCNGYKIGGLGAGPDTLTRGVIAEADNFTIRHCNIRGFLAGLRVRGDGTLIEENRFDQNTRVAIIVEGNGTIRNNLILDTGKTGGEANGILAAANRGGNFDVSGNTIDGVVGDSVTGIELWSGTSSSISTNVVRGLAGGLNVGIDVTRSTQTFIDGNDVVGAGVSSKGYFCTDGGALRNNSSWGFAQAVDGCRDSGGNLHY